MNEMPTPLGVVTFLFTDIERSTRRWEADAAAMRGALAPATGVRSVFVPAFSRRRRCGSAAGA